MEPTITPRRRFGVRKVALSIGFIIIVTVIGTMLVRVITNKGEASPTNQVKSVLSGDELQEYTSPDNGFSIKFPGFPTVDKSSNTAEGKEIPITTYQRLIDDNSKNYTVAVYDYGDVKLDEEKALDSALTSAFKDKPEIKLGETKKGTYGPYRSVEAAYTQTEQDKTYDAHIRYVIKGSKIYSIIVIGTDQAKFDEFANSLKLN